MNAIVLDLEFSRVGLGPRDVVQALILDVNNAPAIEADQVMMLVELGVEPGGRAGMAGLGEGAEGNEFPRMRWTVMREIWGSWPRTAR